MRKKTILLVDDDPVQLRSVRRLLRSWGWNVITSERPDPAMRCGVTAADIILSDWEMGMYTGADSIEHAKQGDKPIVIWSGNVDLIPLEIRQAWPCVSKADLEGMRLAVDAAYENHQTAKGAA